MRLFIAKKKNHEYCCLMLKLKISPPVWNTFTKELIEEDDVFDNVAKEYGIENRPHITILYGLDKMTDFEKMKKYLPKISDIKIKLVNISNFQSNEKYDVLKFDVESKQLHEINLKLKHKFEHESEYNGYVPHMTISYLKPGKAKKYKSHPFEISVEPESYWFNDRRKDIIFVK